MESEWRVGIDIGGTFTDVVAHSPQSGETVHLKVPSSRENPASSMMSGLEALFKRDDVDPGSVQLCLHGTTIVTNAIVERRLPATALITTAGMRDVLEIGRHWREELYDPFLKIGDPLVPRNHRFELDERMTSGGEVMTPLKEKHAMGLITGIRDRGFRAVAVSFLHSYANPDHEQQLGAMLRNYDDWFVCCSSELSREVREFERTSTTVLNVALMPIVAEYLERIERGLDELRTPARLYVTQSNGGATTPRTARARPVGLALSGPVGGVMSCAEIGRRGGWANIISLDIGGTSTDVSVISDYEPRFTTELSVGELPVRMPSVQVRSIGAGGGSIAYVDAGGALKVGPQSAGAEPGPACYGRGGLEPTVTDCQLLLGRLAEDLPLGGDLRLDKKLAHRAIRDELADRLGWDSETAAAGAIDVADAAMERAVRVALRQRGDDPRDFHLIAFGGAGPLHAAELGRRLGVRGVIVPRLPGTLSAFGFLTADVRLDFARSDIRRSNERGLAGHASSLFSLLENEAEGALREDEQLSHSAANYTRSCDIRYVGQAYEVSIPVRGGSWDSKAVTELMEQFHQRHERIYGFSNPEDACEFVTYRLSAHVPLKGAPPAGKTGDGRRGPIAHRDVYVKDDGWASTPVYDRQSLPVGAEIEGPAIVHQSDATTFIPSSAGADVDAHGNLLVTLHR